MSLEEALSLADSCLKGGNLFQSFNDLEEYLNQNPVPAGRTEGIEVYAFELMNWFKSRENDVAMDVEDAEDRLSSAVPMFSKTLDRFKKLNFQVAPEDQESIDVLKEVLDCLHAAFDAKYNYTGQKEELGLRAFEKFKTLITKANIPKTTAFMLAVRHCIEFTSESGGKFNLRNELIEHMNIETMKTFGSESWYYMAINAFKTFDHFNGSVLKNDAERTMEALLIHESPCKMSVLESCVKYTIFNEMQDPESKKVYQMLRRALTDVVNELVADMSFQPERSGSQEDNSGWKCTQLGLVVNFVTKILSYKCKYEFTPLTAIYKALTLGDIETLLFQVLPIDDSMAVHIDESIFYVINNWGAFENPHQFFDDVVKYINKHFQWLYNAHPQFTFNTISNILLLLSNPLPEELSDDYKETWAQLHQKAQTAANRYQPQAPMIDGEEPADEEQVETEEEPEEEAGEEAGDEADQEAEHEPEADEAANTSQEDN